MKQLRQVVMLPTEKATDIHIWKDILYYGETNLEGYGIEYKHLYLTSDEEIKEGDWYLFSNVLLQSDGGYKRNCPKIIATTDKSLLINTKDIYSNNSIIPQIPESFIKAYVESGGTIKEVLVEYEEQEEYTTPQGNAERENYSKHKVPYIKTREDNTVIISQAKTYTREEVIEFAQKYARRVVEKNILNGYKAIHNQLWIKENL